MALALLVATQDAAETRFDRRLYGKARDKKWWEEIKKKRLRDVEAETINQ